MRLAICQTAPRFADVEANLAVIRARLAPLHTDLAVFPECALTGYSFESRADAMRCAETKDGPTLAAIAATLRETQCGAALVGFLERDGDRLFNAAALVTRTGVRGVYRKSHLLHLGVDRVDDPGDLGFAPFELGAARFGVQICFDFSFPEPSRMQKLAGAQLIVVPTNWPEQAEVSCDHTPRVRAQENHIFVATCDRVGEEAGIRFRGRSRVIDCDSRVIAEASATDEDTLEVDLDLERADANRVVYTPGRYELDRIAARRVDLYGNPGPDRSAARG